MNLNLTPHFPKKTYNRNGKECVLCKIRNRLIVKTPEEKIRQGFVNFLLKEKNVPLNHMEIEFPLTRKIKGERKRADIVVFGDAKKSKILLVVECKKANWTLTDKDKQQAQYYSSALKANCVIVTNGSDHVTLKKFGRIEKRINIIPKYSDLFKQNSLKRHIIRKEPYRRHDLMELMSGKAAKNIKKWGHIGVDTDRKFHNFISNLVDLLFDCESKFDNLSFSGYKIVKDLGTIIDSYGNAAGGQWAGEYKKFLVKDQRENHQTIGIGIFGSKKFNKDPKFGNSRGFTSLLVSIDDFEKSHNSLQLNIEKNVKKINNHFYVNHSGKLTNGHQGSVKHEIVRNYIRKKSPHLIGPDNQICLGILPDNQLYRSNEKHSKKLIKNLIEYAIRRDEIRRRFSTKNKPI